MINFFKDIKKGENLELYIIIFVGIILTIMSVTGKYYESEIVSAVIVTLLSVMAYGLLKSRKQTEELNLQTKNLESKIELIDLNNSIYEFGLTNVYNQMPFDEFYNRINDSKTKRVRILQTWLKGTNPITDEMIEAVKRGVDFEVILINPKSKMATIRTQDIGLEKTVDVLRHCLKELEQQLKITK